MIFTFAFWVTVAFAVFVASASTVFIVSGIRERAIYMFRKRRWHYH